MAKQIKTKKSTKAKAPVKQSRLKLQKEKDYSQSIIIAILSTLLVLVSVNIIISAVSANNLIINQDDQIDNLRRENARLKVELGEDTNTEEQTEVTEDQAETTEEDSIEQGSTEQTE